MATTIASELIIDAFKVRMAKITKANGYYTDLGKNVFGWRANPLSTDELPALVWRDATEPIGPNESVTEDVKALWMRHLTLECEIQTANNGDQGATMRQAVEDFYKIIGNDGSGHTYRWEESGADVINTDTSGREKGEAAQDEESVIATTVTITIHYRTQWWSES